MPKRLDVIICGGTNCSSSGSLEIRERLEQELEKRGLKEEINVLISGCMGLCQLGPNMVVYPDENQKIAAASISPGDISQRRAQMPATVKGCLLYTSPSPRDRTRSRMPSSA